REPPPAAANSYHTSCGRAEWGHRPVCCGGRFDRARLAIRTARRYRTHGGALFFRIVRNGDLSMVNIFKPSTWLPARRGEDSIQTTPEQVEDGSLAQEPVRPTCTPAPQPAAPA